VSIYLDEFETLYGISDNIEKLRNKILELAFKGELVSKKEKHAKPELDKIITKKNKMIKNKIIRKPYGGIKDIKDSDKPHKIPKYWEWVRLGQIMNFQNGYAFKSSEFISKGVGIVKIGNISNGQISEIGMNFISKEKEVDKKYYVEKNDMLIAMSGATTGKLGINKNEKTYYLNQRVGKITPIETNQKYMYYYLKTLMAENLEKSSGSAIPNLSTKQINNLMFPFAPLEEQKRIVDKIEKLMKEVDKLEIKLKEKENVSQNLSESIVEAIKSSQDAEELKESLRFVIDNFDVIFKTSESMEEMKNIVLQLAIEGKLVPQNENEESAFELLKEIDKEIEELNKKGEFKKIKSKFKNINKEEIPFEIPKKWEWRKLGSIISITSGKNITKKEMSDHNDYEVYGGNGITGYYNDFNVKKPTIVIGRVGYYCGNVHLTEGKAWITDNAFITRYPYKSINKNWLVKVLKALNLGQNNSSTAQPVVSQKKIYPILIPIPPLPEQDRISNKVDSIMSIIDKLKKELIKKEDLVEKLGSI
jgi:type I restriction enzyme S subunit